MDRDRKSTALKSLQGKIWKAGFESGELKGTAVRRCAGGACAMVRAGTGCDLFVGVGGGAAAAVPAFESRRPDGHDPGYFDTRTGPKRARASYAAIARAFGAARGGVLFFLRCGAELDAARDANCRTRLVIRPGNPPVDGAHGHDMIRSFDEAT